MLGRSTTTSHGGFSYEKKREKQTNQLTAALIGEEWRGRGERKEHSPPWEGKKHQKLTARSEFKLTRERGSEEAHGMAAAVAAPG